MTPSTFEQVLDAVRLAIREVRPDVANGIEIGESTPLFSAASPGALDLDSLDALEIVTVLEQQHGLVVADDADLTGLETVGDVVRLLLADAV